MRANHAREDRAGSSSTLPHMAGGYPVAFADKHRASAAQTAYADAIRAKLNYFDELQRIGAMFAVATTEIVKEPRFIGEKTDAPPVAWGGPWGCLQISSGGGGDFGRCGWPVNLTGLRCGRVRSSRGAGAT
jgi:hypothetical protein